MLCRRLLRQRYLSAWWIRNSMEKVGTTDPAQEAMDTCMEVGVLTAEGEEGHTTVPPEVEEEHIAIAKKNTSTDSAKSVAKERKRKRAKEKSLGDKETAKPPNYFLAVQVNNPEIKGSLKAIQDCIISQEKLLRKAVVSVSSAHLTTGLLHLATEEAVAEACDMLQSCKDDLNRIVKDSTLSLDITGLGHFRSAVVYAKIVQDDNEDKLRAIADVLQDKFAAMKADNSFTYTPHLTLMKLSKVRGRKVKKKIRRIDSKYYESFKDFRFGVQPVQSVQLLSMFKKKQSDGYYHCDAEIPIGPQVQDRSEFDPKIQYAKFLSSYSIMSGICKILTPAPDTVIRSGSKEVSKASQSECCENSDLNKSLSDGCDGPASEAEENVKSTLKSDPCAAVSQEDLQDRDNCPQKTLDDEDVERRDEISDK